MANPYAVDHQCDSAPMDRVEFDRLVRNRLLGRCAMALGIGCYLGFNNDVDVLRFRLSGAELSAIFIFLGMFFMSRALRCRTREFDRMKGFVQYQELEARAQELNQDR